MEKQILNYVNRFVVRGNIIWMSNKSANTLILTIGSTRAEKHPSEKIRVFCFQKYLIEDMLKELKVGDKVTVQGVIQTSRKYPEGTPIITEYTKEHSGFDATFLGKESKRDINSVMVRGIITKIHFHANNKAATFSILVEDYSRKNYIIMTCFQKTFKYLNNKKVGDIIEAIGYMQTPDRDEKTASGKSKTPFSIITLAIQ